MLLFYLQPQPCVMSLFHMATVGAAFSSIRLTQRLYISASRLMCFVPFQKGQ